MFTRKCPQCESDVVYEKKQNRDVAVAKGQVCRRCSYINRDQSGNKNPFFGKTHSAQARKRIASGNKSFTNTVVWRKKMSALNSGSGNPMYGRSVRDVWEKKYGNDRAKVLYDAMCDKVSLSTSGHRNPMFGKPSPNGSGNGWSGWYKGWYFRSLKELSYMVKEIEKKQLKWRSGETSDLKVPYVDWAGNKRTYMADFLIDEKYLIEVKPEKLKSSRINRLKGAAAEKFCAERGFVYKVESPVSLTDNEIMALYVSGDLIWLPRYDIKFKERFLCPKKLC